MSSQVRCPICKRVPQEPINLRCQHHPCYQCSQSLLALESQTKIETKYRIICPACTQKTVFYDLRHLILEGHRSNDEEYFVTDRYLSKPEIKAPLRHNNYISSENNSQPITRRGSIHSIANTGTINSIVNNNKSMLEVKCLDHGEPYKYFCSDCCGKPAKNVLLCCECAKPHYNGGHRLLSLRQSEAKLLRLNMDSKDEMVSRQGQITYIMDYLRENKGLVEDYFGKMEQNLEKEFSTLLSIIQSKYKSLSQTLRVKYEENMKLIDSKIEKLAGQQKILESLKDIDLKDLETNMKFYQTYEKFTLNTQTTVDIEFSKLPELCKLQDFTQVLAQDWILIKDPSSVLDFQHSHKDLSSQKKSRRPSNAEDQYSQRSAKEKENYRGGLSPHQLKMNQRKMLC